MSVNEALWNSILERSKTSWSNICNKYYHQIQTSIVRLAVTELSPEIVNRFRIHYYGESSAEKDDSADIQSQGYRFAKRLKIDQRLTQVSLYKDTCKIIGLRPNGIRVSILIRKNEQSKILVIRAEGNQRQLCEMEVVIKDMSDVSLTRASTGRISVSISGLLSEKLSEDKAQSAIKAALKGIHARPIEGIQNHELTSLSAYSSKLPIHLRTNGRKMNVQIALHSDDSSTYFHVGSPIIIDSY